MTLRSRLANLWMTLKGSNSVSQVRITSGDAVEPPHTALRSMHDVDEMIREAGFDAVAGTIHKRARPCFRIHASDNAVNAPGITRFGGLPDLPAKTVWPTSSNEPLLFLAQINLADLEHSQCATALPSEGLLSVFAGDIDGKHQTRAVAMFTPKGSVLTGVQAPAKDRTDKSVYPPFKVLKPIAVHFDPAISIPSTSDRLFDQALLDACPDGDFDHLNDCARGGGDGIGQLLGFANSMLDDLHVRIALAELGHPGMENLIQWNTWERWEEAKSMESKLRNGSIYRPWTADDDDNVRWLIANRARIVNEVENWELLLALDSNKEMDFWINDANTLYVFIRSDDLRARIFSRLRVAATQS